MFKHLVNIFVLPVIIALLVRSRRGLVGTVRIRTRQDKTVVRNVHPDIIVIRLWDQLLILNHVLKDFIVRVGLLYGIFSLVLKVTIANMIVKSI